MPILIDKNNIYLPQSNTNQVYTNMHIFKIILNKTFLVFKTQGLYIIINQFSVNC